MTKPKIVEHNVETGEIVEREMTNAEYKLWDDGNKNKIKQDLAQAEAKAAAQAKLAALGLTVEDLIALGL